MIEWYDNQMSEWLLFYVKRENVQICLDGVFCFPVLLHENRKAYWCTFDVRLNEIGLLSNTKLWKGCTTKKYHTIRAVVCLFVYLILCVLDLYCIFNAALVIMSYSFWKYTVQLFKMLYLHKCKFMQINWYVMTFCIFHW